MENLHSRVRRRLFDEVDCLEEGAIDNSKLLDLCDVMEQQTSVNASSSATKNSDVIDLNETPPIEENQTSSSQDVLIITNEDAPNSECMQLLAELIVKRNDNNWTTLKYTDPNDALHHTHQNVYREIYTDLDIPSNSQMLRVVCSIRKSCINNARTPIIAMCQIQGQNNSSDNLCYFGVSFVCYGKLSAKMYNKLQNSLKEMRVNSTTAVVSTIYINESECSDTFPCDKQLKDDHYNIYLQNSNKPKNNEILEKNATTTNENSVSSVPRNTHISATTASNKSESMSVVGTVIHFSDTTKFPNKSTVNIDNKAIILEAKNLSSYEMHRQAQIVKPFIQRPIINQVQHPPVQFAPRTNFYHQYPSFPKYTIDSHEAYSYSNQQSYNYGKSSRPETPYMVSGDPGSDTMIITMLSDDLTKHSSKERLRRERIKFCCEQFRELLPKGYAKKIDMATVMELTVFYIKMLQKYTNPLSKQQCEKMFETYFKQLSNKRLNESDHMTYNTQPLPKVIKLDTCNLKSDNKQSSMIQTVTSFNTTFAANQPVNAVPINSDYVTQHAEQPNLHPTIMTTTVIVPSTTKTTFSNPQTTISVESISSATGKINTVSQVHQNAQTFLPKTTQTQPPHLSHRQPLTFYPPIHHQLHSTMAFPPPASYRYINSHQLVNNHHWLRPLNFHQQQTVDYVNVATLNNVYDGRPNIYHHPQKN